MHTLSEELLVLLNNNKQLNKVTCGYFEDKYYAILKMIRHSLLHSKSSMLVVPPSEMHIVQELFNNADFSDLVLFVEKNSIQNISHIQARIARSKIFNDTIVDHYQEIKQQVDKSQKSIHSYVKDVNKIVFSTKTYKDIEELASKATQLFTPNYIKYRLDNSKFNFSLNEYQVIKNDIEEALVLYQPRFFALNQYSMFSEECFKLIVDTDDITRVSSIIHNLRLRAITLLEKYFITLDKLSIMELRGSISTHSNVEVAINRLIIEIQNEDSSSDALNTPRMFQMFSKSKKNLLKYSDQFNDILFNCEKECLLTPIELNNIPRSFKDISSIDHELVKLRKLLRSIPKIENSTNDEYLVFDNNKHRFLKTLNELESKYNDLIKERNNSKLWKLDWEDSVFDFYDQKIQLQKLVNELITSDSFFSENPSFVFWSSFYSGLDNNSKSVLESLLLLPLSDWKNSFTSWFLNQILVNNISKIDINIELESYTDHSTKLTFIEIESLTNNINLQFYSEYLKIKKTNNKYFNQLNNLTKNKNFSQHIGRESVLLTLYPVAIVSQLDIAFLNSTTLSRYDHVHFCTEQLANDLISSKLYHYFSSDNSDVSDFNIKYNYRLGTSFLGLSSSHQLEPAKQLALQLIELNPKFKLYVHKKQYIISLLSDFRFNQYCSLNSLGLVQEYNKSGNSLDNLTDILLSKDTDFSVTLLVNSFIFNITKGEELDWQLYLAKCFKNAGCEIILVNNNSLSIERPLKSSIHNKIYDQCII